MPTFSFDGRFLQQNSLPTLQTYTPMFSLMVGLPARSSLPPFSPTRRCFPLMVHLSNKSLSPCLSTACQHFPLIIEISSKSLSPTLFECMGKILIDYRDLQQVPCRTSLCIKMRSDCPSIVATHSGTHRPTGELV